MRHRAMLSLAIAGMFILASAAVSRANWYHKSESSQGSSSEMTSPSSEQGTEAPEAGTYERQEATEAGKLPPGEDAMGPRSEFRSGGNIPGENIPLAESNGEVYRLGIDTGP